METPDQPYEVVEVAIAERLALEQRHFDRGVGGVDQALEDADIVGVHSVKGGFGVAAEQKVHLLRAPMGGPPQRPAAAHSKITAGHDDGSRSRVYGLERARPTLSRAW